MIPQRASLWDLQADNAVPRPLGSPPIERPPSQQPPVYTNSPRDVDSVAVKGSPLAFDPIKSYYEEVKTGPSRSTSIDKGSKGLDGIGTI
ncbi:hypothetical protein FRC02_008808 [Tulasnella sp. 418]|nr:hypothetical protein FRC02_008808 [Tulasnella sp. 418]